jgi:hypothetical protein
MSLLVSFSLHFCHSTCFERSLPIFRSYFAALVAVGLTNEYVIVWCGVRWLVQSNRSLQGTSQTGPCKDLLLWTNHRTPHHTITYSFVKLTATNAAK